LDRFDVYEGREASAVKHAILRHYLERLAFKVGYAWPVVNYVEGFAGPWKSATTDLSDTSPHIALHELRKARAGLAKAGRHPRFRCLFVERGKRAATRLQASLEESDDIEAKVLQGTFLEKVPEIMEFISVPQRHFTFLFVDPKGWTKYDPDVIAPLLREPQSEVLINFMTEYVNRFVGTREKKTHASFLPLFGSEADWAAWQGLKGRDREEAILAGFMRRIKELGGYRCVVAAVVLDPTRDRSFFHLVYGTRSIDGLRAFREAEYKSLSEHRSMRQVAKQRHREQRTGQPQLFRPGQVEGPSYVDELRLEYHKRARQSVEDRLRREDAVRFDGLEETALLHPMVRTKDLRDWLAGWRMAGLVRYEGLGERERSLKPGKEHRVVWNQVGVRTSDAGAP